MCCINRIISDFCVMIRQCCQYNLRRLTINIAMCFFMSCLNYLDSDLLFGYDDPTYYLSQPLVGRFLICSCNLICSVSVVWALTSFSIFDWARYCFVKNKVNSDPFCLQNLSQNMRCNTSKSRWRIMEKIQEKYRIYDCNINFCLSWRFQSLFKFLKKLRLCFFA